MKKSKKITIGIIVFFLIIALIIIGRYGMGLYFKKKFGNRPPPGVVVETVLVKNFNQTIESYCTALSSKTTSFKIKKNELLEPIKFQTKVKKGDVIIKLQNKNITAPFAGSIGTRGISSSSLGTDSIIVTLDDSEKILCDLQIPEVFAAVLRKDLRINARFQAYKDKLYTGKIISHASRVNSQTRSILAKAQIENKDLQILPGSLLNIELFYNEKEALSVADTSIMFEDEKKFVYKILDNNKLEKKEIITGIRNGENIEILEGLSADDQIVKEGLSRLSNGMLVKPLVK
tara:strand:- start:188 stop:1054 length:867 start_codon:yes stop_codon:yes gene_type:complete